MTLLKINVGIPVCYFMIFAIFTISSISHSATYHVRTDGHNSNCNGSANAPATSAPNCAFISVQKGVDVATTAGDVVIVHTGDYSAAVPTITSKASGSNSTTGLITIEADGDVTIARAYITHNYIKVNGFIIKKGLGYYIPTFYISGNYVQATNNCLQAKGGWLDATGNGTYGFYVIGTHSNISGNTIEGISYDIGLHNGSDSTTLSDSTKNWSADYTGEKIYNLTKNISGTITSNTATTISSNIANVFTNNDTYLIGNTYFIVVALGGANNLFNNNIIKNVFNAERIFNVGGVGNIISNNEVYNFNGIASTGIHPDIFQSVSGSSSRDHIIEKNYFHDMSGVQIGNLETSIGSTASYNWIFRNNVFANINGPMFGYIESLKYYNNTFYRCGGTDQILWTSSNSSNSEFKNNIFIGNSVSNTVGWWGKSSGSPTGIVGEYNYVAKPDYSARTGFSETGGVSGGDPKFIAAYNNCIINTCDFRLQKNSPAKDKGLTLTGFADDKDGIDRPHGYGWDIGAYEYNVPEPPRDLKIK
jgi:hypothetical protein